MNHAAIEIIEEIGIARESRWGCHATHQEQS